MTSSYESAWDTKGWTAQNFAYVWTGSTSVATTLPADFQTVTVKGSYTDIAGNTREGFVIFRNDYALKDIASKMVILPGEYKVQVIDGSFSVALPVGNDPTIAGDPTNPEATNGVIYHVKEVIAGGRQYDILVPYNATSPQDITDLYTAS